MLDMELYLIRHAETVMNINPHLVGGRSNEVELTAEGIEQSRRLGRYLLAKQIFPSKVYSSPAVRTLRTAEYVLKEMGLEIEPVISDLLQELSQGSAEGKLRIEVYTSEVLRKIAQLGKDFKLEGGESMNDVGIRMHEWVIETFAQDKVSEKPERVFVFTHGGAIKYYASHLLDWNHKKTYETVIDNASISLFTRQNDQWKLEYLNRTPMTSDLRCQ